MGLFRVIIIAFLLLQISCGDCGGDTNLGSIDLSTKSLTWIPYNGSETLRFVNTVGEDLKLTSPKGIESSRARLNVKTLCDEGLFDRAHEFYWIQRRQITFSDSIGRPRFYLDLLTQFEDLQASNDIALYDLLTIVPSFFEGPNAYVKVITDEQVNLISNGHRLTSLTGTRFIGDTLFQTTPFKDVYEGKTGAIKTGGEKFTYFNKDKGVLAFYETGGETWTLVE